MFFFPWLVANFLLHLALGLLWIEYKDYSTLSPTHQLEELRESFDLMRARFIRDAFWIDAEYTSVDEGMEEENSGNTFL